MAIEHKLKIKKDYKYFCEISTRWNDNDVRWHVNNAKYYEFFDTVINKMLMELNSLSLKAGKNIFVTAETGCKYFEEISFPDKIIAGLKIDYIGNTSIRYDIGLFKNFLILLLDKIDLRVSVSEIFEKSRSISSAYLSAINFENFITIYTSL